MCFDKLTFLENIIVERYDSEFPFDFILLAACREMEIRTLRYAPIFLASSDGCLDGVKWQTFVKELLDSPRKQRQQLDRLN